MFLTQTVEPEVYLNNQRQLEAADEAKDFTALLNLVDYPIKIILISCDLLNPCARRLNQ